MSRDDVPQVAPAALVREFNLIVEYLQQQLAIANEREEQFEAVADSLTRANERAGNLEHQLEELAETNAALSTTNAELSNTNAELTDEFEDSTAYTGHLHEEVHTLHLEVGFLNEQLRGLHEHQRQQYFLHQQRQAGANPAPIAATVANPTLSINNPLIVNDRLRATVLSLRAQVHALHEQKKELEAEITRLRERCVALTTPTDFEQVIATHRAVVPVEIAQLIRNTLRARDEQIAALQALLDREETMSAEHTSAQESTDKTVADEDEDVDDATEGGEADHF